MLASCCAPQGVQSAAMCSGAFDGLSPDEIDQQIIKTVAERLGMPKKLYHLASESIAYVDTYCGDDYEDKYALLSQMCSNQFRAYIGNARSQF